MLRVGTVFSGIGAFEHALDRMEIPYKIQFACDTGDVDILSKDIDDSFKTIEDEFDVLKNEEDELFWLSPKFEAAQLRLNKVKKVIKVTKRQMKELDEVLVKYLNDKYVNSNQMKAYEQLKHKIDSAIDDYDRQYAYIKLCIKLDSDIKKGSGLRIYEYSAGNNITEDDISEFKKVLKEVKLISEEVSMIYESKETEKIREKVFAMDTLEEQKRYVDNLYAGNEDKNKVRTTYFANYDITEDRYHWNISFLDGRKFKDEIDIFVGGSPCQSFSLVGKQRGLEDTRGTLFYEFARLVKEINPKVFIFENVKAVLTNNDGKTWKTMSETFDHLNYDWKMQILNAKDYGIPQNRERIFVVGIRKDLKANEFNFPKPIPLTTKLQDYLLDNVSGKYYLRKKGVEFVTADRNIKKRYTQIDGEVQLCQKKNQQFNWHGDFVFVEENKNKEHLVEDLKKYFLSEKVKKYVLKGGTKGFYAKPEIDLEIARPLLTTMHKMHRAGIDNYVTTEGRIRKLTPRECFRLMGFCDSFKIVVSDTSAYQQSGNSIVVNVLMEIMKEVIKAYPKLIK